MFARIGFLIGLFLSLQNTVFALMARSPLPPSDQMPPYNPSFNKIGGVMMPQDNPIDYIRIFEGWFIAIFTLIIALYLIVSHYRRVRKSEQQFTRKDFFEIVGKLSLLFGLGYMALALFEYALSKYFFY